MARCLARFQAALRGFKRLRINVGSFPWLARVHADYFQTAAIEVLRRVHRVSRVQDSTQYVPANRDTLFPLPTLLYFRVFGGTVLQAKPLVLLSLLREMVGRQADLSVVFTSSVDSTHRLFRLLQLFGGKVRTVHSFLFGPCLRRWRKNY